MAHASGSTGIRKYTVCSKKAAFSRLLFLVANWVFEQKNNTGNIPPPLRESPRVEAGRLEFGERGYGREPRVPESTDGVGGTKLCEKTSGFPSCACSLASGAPRKSRRRFQAYGCQGAREGGEPQKRRVKRCGCLQCATFQRKRMRRRREEARGL